MTGAPAASQDAAYAPPKASTWLPDEARLEMPAQDFWTRPAGKKRPPLGESDFWQMGVFAMAGALSAFGGVCAYSVVQDGGLNGLEIVNLVLFQILFAWIAWALASALIGFSVSLNGDPASADLQPTGPVKAPRGRTAILMPVHNEDPDGVFGRLNNIDVSLRAFPGADKFHIFVLSDTRDLDIRCAEQAAFAHFLKSSGQEGRLFYRLRTDNTGRKAGNIAEWVRRFGGAYDYMVVLDADSVMDGETLMRLAGFMDDQPNSGLIQTVPRLVNRQSVFGRMQQFASRLYGPMLSEGLAHTSGVAGNYWGHNAIIRTAAFAAHAGLPLLKGPRPLGGEILSHDFVEAALLRRAGWDIRLAPQLEGSYEECPPTLPHLIVRERRWCQGNLQHLPLIGARGLHWMSRVHLTQGVLTYLMPPVWLLFLLVGGARSAEATYVRAQQFDAYTLDLLKWLLSISLLGLFAPRLLALARALIRSKERRQWGSAHKLVLGVLAEASLSALMSPILMTAQVKALFDIVLGRDSGWSAQEREERILRWKEAGMLHLPQTVFGVVLGIGAFIASPIAALWMAPVILGLVLAIPIARWTSDPALGLKVEKLGLFLTPEELSPPAVLAGLSTPPVIDGRAIAANDWRLILDNLFIDSAPVEAEA